MNMSYIGEVVNSSTSVAFSILSNRLKFIQLCMQ